MNHKEASFIHYREISTSTYELQIQVLELKQTCKLDVNPKGNPLRLAESLDIADKLHHCLIAEFDKVIDFFKGVLEAHDQISLF